MILLGETEKLLETGIGVVNKTFRANIICFICYAHARVHFKCFVQFIAYFSCEHCTKKVFILKAVLYLIARKKMLLREFT